MKILATQRIDFAGYMRLDVNVVAPNATDDELRVVAERYVRRELVDAVILFVWSAAELVGQVPFHVARVQFPKGEKRWTRDDGWLARRPTYQNAASASQLSGTR